MSSSTSNRAGATFSLKISLLYAAFFVLASIGLFVTAYYLIATSVRSGERELIRAQIQEYRAWYTEGGLAALKSRFVAATRAGDTLFFIRVVGPENKALFASVPRTAAHFRLQELDTKGLTTSDSWLFIDTGNGGGSWTVATVSLPDGLILQVGKNSAREERILSQLRDVFLLVTLPVVFLGVCGGWLLTFRAFKPVRELISTVQRIITTGSMSERVPVREKRGEMSDLVSLFNQMLEKNESLIKGMHQSLDNVAHDLRTPMTRLRGAAEFALQDPENKRALREALADCLEESDRVLTMLHTLMDVAEAETGAMRLEITEVSVPELVKNVVDLYEFVAEEKHIAVRTKLPARLSVEADRNRLQQVIANLLDNALKYSGDGREIEVSASQEDRKVVISVSDQGLGISANEIHKIWDRLYRGDRSRSERGLGLGLSFVRAIVEAHGGRVHVSSDLNKGAVFKVELPTSRPLHVASDFR